MGNVREVIEKAINKYNYLQTETVYLETYRNTIRINWTVYNDRYISKYKVQQIANFLHKFLPSYIIYNANCENLILKK